MVEHQGIAPCIPVWKTGVYLSTPMLEMKLESRAGVAPTCTVLQTAAWAARPTGPLNADWRMQSVECRTEAFASAGTVVRLFALNQSYLRIWRARALSRR